MYNDPKIPEKLFHRQGLGTVPILPGLSKITQKSKTILGVIRNIVLDFILYFVTAYIITESTLYMAHEHRKKHQIQYASPEKVNKKNFMTKNLQQ